MDAPARFELKHNGDVVGVLHHGAIDHVSEQLQDDAFFWCGLRALRGPIRCSPRLRLVAVKTPIWLDQA